MVNHHGQNPRDKSGHKFEKYEERHDFNLKVLQHLQNAASLDSGVGRDEIKAAASHAALEDFSKEDSMDPASCVRCHTDTYNKAHKLMNRMLCQAPWSVNLFSPEGRLFQVEYAIEAIKLGSTAIGIQTSEGVVLAVERRVTSPLIIPSSIEKIYEIDSHIGCAMSGLIADSRTMVDKARVEAQNHWFTYNEPMTVESVTQSLSNLALAFGKMDITKGTMSRPFGVALLMGGIDEKGPQLYHLDPSGTFLQYEAKAIGSASEGAQSSLQEVYHKSMTLREACVAALSILKQVMEEKLNSTNVELCTVTREEKFKMFKKEEIETLIKEIKS